MEKKALDAKALDELNKEEVARLEDESATTEKERNAEEERLQIE